MRDILSILHTMHFDKPCFIQGRSSIADLFKPGRRTGIYVFHFSSGEFYAGRAVDVTRRFVQHKKNHNDIKQISFRPAQPDELDQIEREVISTLEREGFPLRNVSLTSMPKGESDFDLIMPCAQQRRWLANLAQAADKGGRPVDPALRRKYQRKFDLLQHQPYTTEVINILREYVRWCLPVPKRSEVSFWSCSCLPACHNPDLSVYSRINIYWQEVLSLFAFEGDLWCLWHLALSPLKTAFGPRLAGLEEHYPNIEIDDHVYEPGGPDQINIVTQGQHSALHILQDQNILKAIRLFNLRLMRKGPCNFSRSHCFDLADQLLEDIG